MRTYPAGERDHAFADSLEAVARGPDGRRALAILRRSAAGGPAAFEAIRVLDRVIPRGSNDRDFDTYALVAGLYAVYHQGRTAHRATEGDLGESWARLGVAAGWEVERAARRLTPLLAADRATLGERLRHAVTLLRSADVPINWARLAHDVRAWGWDDQPVQRRWARSFVAGHAPEVPEADHPTTPEGEDR